MTKRLLHITFAAAAAILCAAPGHAEKAKNVLDLKNTITDSNIIFPESYEVDTQKMMEGWYLKNYTATDDRYKRLGDTNVSDDVIRDRLSKMNTIIEMPFNQIVRSYIDRYTVKSRGAVSAMLGLSIYYMPIFEQALEEAGLPLELKYLPVIESALNPNATSRSGAAGLWQFMLITGKGMDLEISSLVDERRDPYLSSKKAAKYLKDLYNTYHDWSLAIAAYNCGPGTVNKALRRAGGDSSTHDFWAIYNYLPAETRGYVPQFIAANYVMTYYPYHNISPVLATKPLVTDTLMISNRVHFNQISKVLDIPLDELRVLNPQFRADIIPGRPDRMYTLVLPSQQCHAYLMSEDEILSYDRERYAQRTDAQPGQLPGSDAQLAYNDTPVGNSNLDDDSPLEEPVETVPAPRKNSSSSGMKTVAHKVEPGETLSSIAQKYDVSADDIKVWNNLTRNSIRTGQHLRITTTAEIADASGAKEVAPAKSQAKTQPAAPRQDNNWNADQSRGKAKKETPKETPTAKSRTAKNDTKAKADTKAKNDTKADTKSTRNSKQAKNDKTTAKNDTKGKGKKSKKAEQQKAAAESHSVKSGENLTVIAKKHGVTVEELKKANNLKDDKLRPGDNLKVPSKSKSNSKKSSTKSNSKSSKNSSSSKSSTSKKKKK